MSDFSKLIGLDKLTSTFSKIKNAVDETEADAESLIASGAAAVTTVEAALATPQNIPNDIVAVTAAFNDLKAGFTALQDIYTLAKGAISTATATKAASVAVVTTAPITVPHPVTGAPVTIPVGTTISVPVPAAPESAAPLTFPPTDGSGDEDTFTPGVIQSPDFTPGGGPSESDTHG